MAVLTIRGFPDELFIALKHEAVDKGVTLRELVLSRLQGLSPVVKTSKPRMVERLITPEVNFANSSGSGKPEDFETVGYNSDDPIPLDRVEGQEPSNMASLPNFASERASRKPLTKPGRK